MLQGGLFIKRLASEVGIEVETSQSLWGLLVAQVQYRLGEGQHIDFGLLGRWTLSTATEFVLIDGATTYLIPPALGLNISPQDVPTSQVLSNLIEALHRQSTIPEETVKAWLASVPRLSLELLDAGHEVHWQDLGLWQMQAEHFVFVEDPNLSTALNKPFEHFKPQELTLVDTLTDLPHRTIPLSQLSEPKRHTLTKGLTPQSKISRLSPQTEDELLPQPLIPRQGQTSMAKDITIHHTETTTNDSPQSEQKSGRPWLCLLVLLILGIALAFCLPYVIKYFQSRASEVSISEKALKNVETIKPQNQDSASQFSISDTEDLSHPVISSEIDIPTQQVSTPNVVDRQLLESSQPLLSDDVASPQITPPKEPQQRLGKRSKVDTKISNNKKSTQASTSNLSEPKQTKAEQPKQTEQATRSKRAQIAERITMPSGASLASLAEAKYGHRAFWVYIYEENRERIPNPHQVPVGLMLNLPPAEKYGIDPDNTKSLNQALLLSKSL